MMRKLLVFKDRYPLVGPAFWLLSIQYFVIQLIVGLAWQPPYSIAKNTISDLANTVCGPYGGGFVCSPLHAYMNASFIVLGITIMSGALLIYQEFRKTSGSATGFFCMGLAGLGTVIVGLFPENTIAAAHILGAALPFFFGNVAMVVLGIVLKVPRLMKLYSVFSGILGLVALVFFINNHYLGIGEGGMERITAYPQTIWLIMFGMYMSRSRYQASKNARSLRKRYVD